MRPYPVTSIASPSKSGNGADHLLSSTRTIQKCWSRWSSLKPHGQILGLGSHPKKSSAVDMITIRHPACLHQFSTQRLISRTTAAIQKIQITCFSTRSEVETVSV